MRRQSQVGAAAMTERIDNAQAREDLKRGFDLLRAGKVAEGGAVFSTLLDSPSVAARAAYGSGYSHLVRENYEAAGALFARAVALNPADANAVYYLGCLAERRGDVNEAREQYQRAMRISPQHRWARDQLNKLQQPPGRTGSLDAETKRATDQEPAQQDAPGHPNPQQAGRISLRDIGLSLWDIGRDVLPTAIMLAVLLLASVVAAKIVQSVAGKIPQSAVPPAIGLTAAERGAAIVLIWAIAGLVLLIWRPRSPAGRITFLALVAETLLIVTSGLGDKLGDGGIAQSAAWAAGIVLLLYVIRSALAARPWAARSGVMPGSAAPGALVQQPTVNTPVKAGPVAPEPRPPPSQDAMPRGSYIGIVRNFQISYAQVRQVIAAPGLGMQNQQVWSFILELQDESGRTTGQQKPVQMTGSHIKGILREEDQVAISRREKESRGTLQPRRIKNLSTGGEVYKAMF